MTEDIYQRLADALDRLPNGFPRTASGVEVKLLKRIFSPEEAMLASCLSGTGEDAGVISERLGRTREEVEEKLKSLLRKGLAWGFRSGSAWKFRLAPFMVGIYEQQVDVMDHELAHLFEQYLQEGGAKGIMGYEPALHRVVPALHAIKTELVLPYDDIKPLLLKAISFEVRDCICRKEQELLGTRKCDLPVRMCLNFADRERPKTPGTVTQAEAIAVLDRAEEVGLVHMVSNVARGVTYVCNCCGCCCGILRGITEFGLEKSVARANYYAVADTEQCTGCGTCEERCQVGACSVVDGVAVVERKKCIGCGLCVTGCTSDAMELKQKPDAEMVTPPENYPAWELERLRNRGMMK